METTPGQHPMTKSRVPRVYNQVLRRAYAVMLLVAFSFSLIAPLLSAEPESRLPACCRRDGKHACGMTKSEAPSPVHGLAVKSTKTTCPQFPSGKGTQALAKTHVSPQSHAAPIRVVNPDVIAVQMEVRYRIAFSRAWQKRGPPSFHQA
jgi:hypothetical protein